MEKKEEHNRCKFLVTKFVNKEGLNWAREIKIAKKLLKIYPSIEDWTALKLDFKLNSLAFFLTEEGKKHISILKFNKSKENVLDLFKTKKEVLNKEKVGEDVTKNTTKGNSLLDFLKQNLK